MTFPIAAGLALAGGSLGVFLGKSAISEINPAYYSAPEPRFHSDLAPNRSPANWEQVRLTEEVGLIQGIGAGCIKCRDYPEEYYPVADRRAADGEEDGWAASAPPSDLPVAAEPELERIQAYSAYQVDAEDREPVVADEAKADYPAEESGTF